MHLAADRLARIVLNRASIGVSGVGRRKTHGLEPRSGTQVGDSLGPGNGGRNEVESRVEVVRLDRRTFEQLQYLRPGRM